MHKFSSIFVLFGFLALLLVGCGGAKGLSVTLKGEKTAVKETTSVAVIRPDLRQLQIMVANYKVDVSGGSIMGAPQASKPGELKVAFYIKGDGKEFKMPVEPGEYGGDKIDAAYVSKGGESSDISFRDSGKPVDGKIVIKSIENDTVTGTVEIKHKEDVISGSFKAKIIAKE